MYFLLFKRRMRCKATRFNIRMPLWVYEQAIRLEKLHGKNLARVTSLHTLLVLTVLKMLEATSFEKINPVKKWTRMQNKQCNGVCPFNSSDPLQPGSQTVKDSLKVIKFYNNELQTCRLKRLQTTSSLSW